MQIFVNIYLHTFKFFSQLNEEKNIDYFNRLELSGWCPKLVGKGGFYKFRFCKLVRNLLNDRWLGRNL